MLTSVNVKESWFSQGRFPESCTGTPSSRNSVTYYKDKKTTVELDGDKDRILLSRQFIIITIILHHAAHKSMVFTLSASIA